MLSTIKHIFEHFCQTMTEVMIPLENVFVPPPVDYTPPIILTRYLYIKEDVLASLTMSILDKDYEQAIFWTCELYYSGFKKEVADYLMANYRELFQSKNPRLGKFLDELYLRRKEGAHIVATIARNLAVVSRQFDINGFVNSLMHRNISTVETNKDKPIIPYTEPRLLITLTNENIKRYYLDPLQIGKTVANRQILHLSAVETPKVTLPFNSFPPTKSAFLAKRQMEKGVRNVCKYSTNKTMVELFQCSHKDISSVELAKMHRLHWLYYASFSPIWSRRIEKYGGRINHQEKRVDFTSNDDVEEGEDNDDGVNDGEDSVSDHSNGSSENDDDDDNSNELEEQFYEKYDYELDEQSIDVQSKMVHLNKNVQMQMSEFCEKYGGTMDNTKTSANIITEILSEIAPGLQKVKPKKRFIIIGKVQNEIYAT